MKNLFSEISQFLQINPSHIQIAFFVMILILLVIGAGAPAGGGGGL